MRFLELHLLAFGPFTDMRLDLRGGDKGLHVVCGGNEAGKSTTLRAVRQFLYGFGERAADDFLHSKDHLRIGAEIESDDAAIRFSAIRRRGRKRTFRDASDEQELPESQLSGLLAGRDSSTFVSQFGLNHTQLREGGQEILHGTGDAGQILFAAASGLHHLGQVRLQLDKEIAELFAGRADAQRQLNRLIARRKELRETLASLTVSNSEFDDLRRRRHAAERTAEEIRQKLLSRESERNRLQRLRDALPQISRRNELQGELAALSDAAILPADFAARREKAGTDKTLALHRLERATRELADLEAKIAAAGPVSAIIEHSASIQQLQQGVQFHSTNISDRPELVAKVATLDKRLSELLAGLKNSQGQSPLREQLVAGIREQKGLQSLLGRRTKLLERRRLAADQAEKCKAEQAQATRQLGQVVPPPDIECLSAALAAGLQEGNLEARLAKEEQEVSSMRGELQRATARLRGQRGGLEALEVAPLPAMETLERAEAADADIARATAMEQERLQQLIAELDRLEGEIGKLRIQHAGQLPTEADLWSARDLRDDGWRAVLEAWEKGAETLWGARFRKRLDNAVSLSDAYEESVRRADAIADQLRRDADAANRHAQLIAEKERLEKQSAKLQVKLSDLERQRGELQATWEALWQPLQIEPLSPREMRSWLHEAMRICEEATQLHRREGALAALKQQRDASLAALLQVLVPFEKEKDVEVGSLAAAIRRAQRVKEEVEMATRRRQQLAAKAEELEAQAASQARAVQEVESELAAWNLEWESTLARIHLPQATTPDAALDWLSRAAEALKLQDEGIGLQERIQGIDQRIQQFEQSVGEALQHLAPELIGGQATAVVAQLTDRLKAAQKSAMERESLLRQKDALRKEEKSAAEASVVAGAALEFLCREAKVSDIGELEAAQERAARKRSRQEEVGRIESALRELAAGKSLAEFIGEASGREGLEFEGRLAELDSELEGLKQELLAAHEEKTRAEFSLQQIDAGTQAADLLAEEEEILARLREGALQYTRLKLARMALERGIERFQAKHQGRVVERAGDLLHKLTRGSLSGLKTDYDSEGPPQLKAIRAGRTNELLSVHQLSDGATDQLYLAVRLALLEEQLEGRESMPLVLDDILVHFDDARTSAALEVLAEFSRRAQVLLFTHHERIVELAEKLQQPERIFIHRLGQNRPAGEGEGQASLRVDKDSRVGKPKSRKSKTEPKTEPKLFDESASPAE